MLLDKPFVVVDLEATGGDMAHDRITEIAIIEVCGDRIQRWSSLVNPQHAIPPFVQNMTGISQEMVSQAPCFADIADEVYQRLEGRLLVAHNARFDYGILKNEFRRQQKRFQTRTLCTVKLSRRLFPEEKKHNLDSVMARANVSCSARHRALGDAEGLLAFVQHLRATIPANALEQHLRALSSHSALPPSVDPDLADELPETHGIYTFYDENDAVLLIHAAKNIRQSIMAHFKSEQQDSKSQRLAQQVRRIQWQESLGEFGARLLEGQAIQAHPPRYPSHGKTSGAMCSIQLFKDAQGYLRPQITSAPTFDAIQNAPLFGLFYGARDAKKTLSQRSKTHALCQRLLGIERVTGRLGSPCPARPHACLGACEHQESAADHNARLLASLAPLQLAPWPFSGAIEISEHDDLSGRIVRHYFDQWAYLGRDDQPRQKPLYFDFASYRLLQHQFKNPLAGTQTRPLNSSCGLGA